jgi:hypothetical protein
MIRVFETYESKLIVETTNLEIAYVELDGKAGILTGSAVKTLFEQCESSDFVTWWLDIELKNLFENCVQYCN